MSTSASVFGAPPSDLILHKGPIADFFNAAEFQPVIGEQFLRKYKSKQPKWGPIGYVTYKRTYARPLYPSDLGIPIKELDLGEYEVDGKLVRDIKLVPDPNKAVRSEEYWETLTRILNGMWHIVRCHSHRKNIEFSEATARRKAENMFRRMWEFKWLPPGRGLWMMGTRFMYLKGSAALNNCAYVSTAQIDKEFSEPFTWAMDMSMLGVGIGFGTEGAGKAEVKFPSNLTNPFGPAMVHGTKRTYMTSYDLPKRDHSESLDAYCERLLSEMAWAVPTGSAFAKYEIETHEACLSADKLHLTKTFHTLNPAWHHPVFVIPDSREGWVESVGIVIDAFLKGTELPVFDYSQIRPKGSPIRGFGGTAEGPQFLQWCHENLVSFFLARVGRCLSASDITDIFNEIGACVVSGNVRRSAQIGLGSPYDPDFISLKHDFVNHPNCWNSNNSVFAAVGMDYTDISKLIVSRGEPGLFWLENVRKFGRMGDANFRDKDAVGTNPCGEQTLHNYELCCLVENFPSLHEDEDDFLATLKQSYLYAKAVTLVPSHNKRTNKVMGKNSRIGCSLSGIQQARVKFGTRRFLKMCDRGYKFIRQRDENYSDWLQVRNSIKVTSVKPSGTVSLLPGVTPGIHYATERTYLRRIRFSKSNYMVGVLRTAGYRVYDAPEQPESTVCIDFPVREAHVDKTEREASLNIWEQLELDAAIQEVWADNQVSITIKFQQDRPDIVQEIASALELYETKLKSVSFLPYFETAAKSSYQALPYQSISDDQYEEEIKGLKPFTFEEVVDDLLQESCDTGVCPIR